MVIIQREPERKLVKKIEKATHGILTRFPGKFMAAGGKLVDILNDNCVADGDVDLFLLSGEERDVDELKSFLTTLSFEEIHESTDGHAILFGRDIESTGQGNNLSASEIHLILNSPHNSISPKTPEEVLFSFDLSASRIGVSDGKVITGDGFKEAYKTKTNSLRPSLDGLWLQTLVRTAKYALYKGFDKIDETIFSVLQTGSKYMEEDLGKVFPSCFTQTMVYEYGNGLFPPNKDTDVFTRKNNGGFSNNYDEKNKEFSKFFIKMANSRVIYPVVISALSRMIINSDLKFPLKLLEYEHEGVISDRFARELAHAVYLNSGSDARYFDGKYEPKKHFPESVEFDSVLRKPSDYYSKIKDDGKRTIRTYIEAGYLDFVLSEIERNSDIAEYCFHDDNKLDLVILNNFADPNIAQRLMDLGSSPGRFFKENSFNHTITFKDKVTWKGFENDSYFTVKKECQHRKKNRPFFFTSDPSRISIGKAEQIVNNQSSVERILIENGWFDREPDYHLRHREQAEETEMSF